MKKPVQQAGAAYKKAAGALSAATLDRAQNAVTYRIYGCEDARTERYEAVLKDYEKTAVRSNVWQSALPPLETPRPAEVELDGLSFAYGDEPIFSGLSLTARPGDIIGVTGPVACGKSTFGRVFLCEAPYGGSVRFGGRELSSLSPPGDRRDGGLSGP